MLNNIKDLRAGKIYNVDNKMLYPILRWLSGSKTDLRWCSEINKYFFACNKDVIKGLIFLGLKDRSNFIPYPKAEKQKDDKIFDLKKRLSMRYYGWSSQEFSRNISNLKYINWDIISSKLGCNDNERKILGLTVEKHKKKAKQPEKKESKGLFDFV